MKSILLVDNYDSFTFNLVQLLHETGLGKCVLVKNDALENLTLNEFDGILLSPGPDLPENSGQLMPFVKKWAGIKPILGVCLGHQAIAVVFGAKLYQLQKPIHGHVSFCTLTSKSDVLFKNIEEPFKAGRYHSWAVDQKSLPPELVVTAFSEDHVIMAIRHHEWNLRGIQFHPESVMTPTGHQMMKNWIETLV